MPIVQLFVMLVVFGLFYWGFHRIAAVFGIPGQIIVIVDVVIVIVAVLWLLQAFGLWTGGPTLQLR